MAVKMMAFSAMDKQFIADNMLTDEDFQFDDGNEFEISHEEESILQSFANDIQMHENTLSNNEPVIHKAGICPDLNDLLKDCVFNVDFKTESDSPCSSDASNDNDMSVINIPEPATADEAALLLVDTPPHTPNGAVDMLPDSPVNYNLEPILVPVTSVNGITYTITPNRQTVLSPCCNYKNIQPKVKPSTKTIVPKPGTAGLSPEQMEKLAKGALRIRPPPNFVASLTKKSSSSKSLKVASTKQNTPLSDLEMCAAALKRQERMLKNRESAYQSRIRKKEYVQKLEAELNCITAENSSLREENSRLKLRISDLEKEIQKLKAAFSPKSIKKTLGLMVVFCMITLNLAPYSSFFEKTTFKHLKTDSVDHRMGRVLLWTDGNSTEENPGSFIHPKRIILRREIDDPYTVNIDPTFNSSTCQQFINKTESLRLENDLLGWVERVEKKQKQSKLKKRKPGLDTALPHLATWSKRKTDIDKDIWARRKNKHEILIYETPRKNYEAFFDAIHRRDDTFYFVSFSGDHLLLPAIAHNKTFRPKMSFVMPAMTLNESVGQSDDHISMMQIDCEVMDTKLVFIKESVIPENLRQKSSNVTKSHSKNPGDRHPKRLQSGRRLLQKTSKPND